MISLISNLAREFSNFERLFLPENKKRRRLVFYAESAIYYLYYQDYIEHILKNSELEITYISSDPNDKIFQSQNNRLHPVYLRNLLALAFSRLDAQVLVLTAPDLNSGIIKRAPAPTHHIYAFHGISSIHHCYRAHAFDNYDSILCIGPYQIEETRRTEALYSLKPKELILTGYPLVERLYREHQEYRKNHKPINTDQPLCLIAPTWSWYSMSSTIMDSCIDEIIRTLGGSNYRVWLRPHPEYIKRFTKRVKSIEQSINRTKNIRLQTDLSSMDCLHEADLLITDHSTIAMDYVLATERPVLFIDTLKHIGNFEADLVGLEPVESIFRLKMGLSLAPENISNMLGVLDTLISQQSTFRQTVPNLRSALVSNWQQAAQVGGDYILSKCS